MTGEKKNGGARPGAGRKGIPGGIKTSVILPAEITSAAREIGKGSVSRGIIRAVEEEVRRGKDSGKSHSIGSEKAV
jgi:hypothetical protein